MNSLSVIEIRWLQLWKFSSLPKMVRLLALGLVWRHDSVDIKHKTRFHPHQTIQDRMEIICIKTNYNLQLNKVCGLIQNITLFYVITSSSLSLAVVIKKCFSNIMIPQISWQNIIWYLEVNIFIEVCHLINSMTCKISV